MKKIIYILISLIIMLAYIKARDAYPSYILPIYPLVLGVLFINSNKVKNLIYTTVSCALYLSVRYCHYLLSPQIQIEAIDEPLIIIAIIAMMIGIKNNSFELYEEGKIYDDSKAKNGDVGFFISIISWNSLIAIFFIIPDYVSLLKIKNLISLFN